MVESGNFQVLGNKLKRKFSSVDFGLAFVSVT